MRVLLKPYYTLEAVYGELKRFVNLDSVKDVLLLAKDKKIDVRLHCEGPITLIKASTSLLLKMSYTHATEIREELVATDAAKEALKTEALNAVWILNDEDDFIHLDGVNQEIFLRPINCIPAGPPTSLDFKYAESRWLKGFDPPIVGENLVAVEYDDEIYFVCKSMASNPFGTKLVEIDGQQKILNFRLDSSLIHQLIVYKNYIVTKSSLSNFIHLYDGVYEYGGDVDETLPHWTDLLKPPVKKRTEVFESYKRGVSSFIEQEKRLPTREELWNVMKAIYGFDEVKKVILNISDRGTDWATFRRYFDKHKH